MGALPTFTDEAVRGLDAPTLRTVKAAHRAFHLQELDPFLFELAAKLGWSVAEVTTRISPAELLQWRAYKAYRLQWITHRRKIGPDPILNW